MKLIPETAESATDVSKTISPLKMEDNLTTVFNNIILRDNNILIVIKIVLAVNLSFCYLFYYAPLPWYQKK